MAVPVMRAAELTAQMVAFRQSLGLARKTPGKVPRAALPMAQAAAYYSEIVADIRLLKAIFAADVLPFIPAWVAETDRERVRPDSAATMLANAGIHGVRVDAAGPKIRLKLEQVLKGFNDRTSPASAEAKANKAAKAISDHNKAQLSRQIRSALGVDIKDVLRTEPFLSERMQNFVSENVSRIKNLPADTYRKLEELIPRMVTTGSRHEDIAKEIDRQFGLGEKRSAIIARDQCLKFNGALNAERQQLMGIKSFTWRSVRDERVRAEHVDLDGEVFEYANLPSEGLPGVGSVNCRCSAEPVMAEIMDILRGSQASKGGGRVRAQAGRAK